MDPIKKNTRMAVASLVLGILSVMCFGLFAGIPAIILGHMAHNRSRKQPDQYGGEGMAIAGFATGYFSIITSLIVIGLALGLILPKLSQEKGRAQRITCANNMKQMGLALHMWAQNHGDQFPFNVPEKNGGTLESCESGADIFDVNGWKHLKVLSRELGNPRVLVCPEDASKQVAKNFTDFGAGNLSYKVRSGTNVDLAHPNEVLVRCPIHNNEMMCSGSVVRREKRR